MMQQLTSKQMMDIMEASQKSIRDIDENVNKMKTELEKRLRIVHSIQEYSVTQSNELADLISEGLNKPMAMDKHILVRADIIEGSYEKFGSTVHPAFVKTPYNVFNFSTSAGPVFKNNATVRINDAIREDFKEMLMDDGIAGKSVAYDEFDTPNLEIQVEVNPNDLLGSTDFNIIEFLPWLPGSFDLLGVSVYSMQSYKTNGIAADFSIRREIPSMGAYRFMIDRTRTMYRCTIYVRINFMNSDGKYPFGLKHLYFLKGNYDPSSYIVFRANHGKYIESIGEDIIINDQNGVYESTCTGEAVELYMRYTNGVGTYEIATNQGMTENPIARNIKEYYVRMPVDRSITSIWFNNITDK